MGTTMRERPEGPPHKEILSAQEAALKKPLWQRSRGAVRGSEGEQEAVPNPRLGGAHKRQR